MQSSDHDAGENRDFVTALARGLEVIRSFTAESPEMTLSEVAERTGLSAATVRRSLITLEQLGYVRRRNRRFVLGSKVLTLGASYVESMNLKEVAQDFLVELVEDLHDAASLTVLDGFEVIYIAHVPSDQRIHHRRSAGSRLPAYATSTGLVLLANAPPAQREQLLKDAPLPPYTSRTPVTETDLRARFVRALEDEYAVGCETIEYGAIALAVPVRDGKGRVVAAVNCATTTSVADEKSIVETRLGPLREAARKIGTMLDQYPALANSELP
jgi:IclR family pca regulon transcriptional regulator